LGHVKQFFSKFCCEDFVELKFKNAAGLSWMLTLSVCKVIHYIIGICVCGGLLFVISNLQRLQSEQRLRN